MKIGFLITARLKSTRLPKKLLKNLNGRTVIERVIQRAKQVVQCDDIVLCTSEIKQDDPLERIAEEHDIKVYRGEPVNVLARLKCAAQSNGFDYIVGITADNPMFSIHYANILAGVFRKSPDVEYTYTDGLPLGMNVYGMKRCALETICKLEIIEDTEIWGKLINQPSIFKIHKEEVNEGHFSKFRMTLDEISDYNFFRVIYERCGKNSILEEDEVLKYLSRNQDVVSINSDVVQKGLDLDIAEKIDNFYEKNHDFIIGVKEHICI